MCSVDHPISESNIVQLLRSVFSGSSDIRKQYSSVASQCVQSVNEFYLRDDVSRITTGKKQTVTRGKDKKQKRLLSITRKNLYSKYRSENIKTKISLYLFCRLKPFFDVSLTEKDQDTCLCRIYENVSLLATKLKQIISWNK